MNILEEDLKKLVAPSVAKKVIQNIESWKKTLTDLIPQSYVEVAETVTTLNPVLFTWFFDNKLSNEYSQTGKVSFYADGNVEFNTQADLEIARFESYEDAEKYFLGYFNFSENLSSASELKNIPALDLEKRQKEYQKWVEIFEELKKYGVDVETDNEHSPFVLWLPSLQKVLTGEGEVIYNSIHFGPGEDWSKILMEKVIAPLQKMYALSNVQVPDLSKEIAALVVSENTDKLCNSLDEWVGWLKNIPQQIPFNFKVEDVYSYLAQEKYYFDGKTVLKEPTFDGSEKHSGVIKAEFSHSYLFNGNDIPIKVFTGDIIYFENNHAVINFSGIPRPNRHNFRLNSKAEDYAYYEENTFHAFMVANDRPLCINDNFIKVRDYQRYLKPSNFVGTWEEASFELIRILSFINAFLGEGIKKFS